MTVTISLLEIVGIAALAAAIGAISSMVICLWCWKDYIKRAIRLEHEDSRAIKVKH